MAHQHPANILRHDTRSRSQIIVDKAVKTLGSVKFIVYQTVIVVLWIALNITAIVYRWDPYPFILLNLAFSTQAAYATPFILLSQNKQVEHDRVAAEHAYAVSQNAFEVDEKTLALLQQLHAEHGEMLKQLLSTRQLPPDRLDV
jgi:uncharacterized membrane protein